MARRIYSPKCTVDDCALDHYAKGFCRNHYGRWKKWGDPLKGSAFADDLVEWALEVLRRYSKKPELRLLRGGKQNV